MNPGMVAVAPPAKNVVVYRNGDPFFNGRKFVVSQRRFLTFEAFLNEVTSMIQAPVAIRSIYTPRHGHRVSGLEELQNGSQYVAGGFERFKRLNYLNPEMKQLNRKLKKDSTQNHPGISQRMSVPVQWKRRTNLPCIIHVFRNGDLLSPPFRQMLTRNALREWSTVLSLVSEKARLHSGAVKKLYKLNGDVVSRGEELVSGDYYVAVGLEKYKNLPYFELLVPPKIVRRSFRNLPNNRRWPQNQGLGHHHLPSQDGSSDSALLRSPKQLNLRRVQSTGVVQPEKHPNTSAATMHKQAPKYPHKDKKLSVFHAKPAQVERISPNSYQSIDQEGSIYKMKGAREEMAHAQEVGEDEDTQVELPLDQRAAETVDEEVVPKTNPLPRRKVGTTEKVQTVQSVQHAAGDSRQEETRKSRFHPAWRKASEK
ncbi:doublecortin domain-containing protein 2B isoform X2 [Sceloporus undulatus]|uniref:doublecortin domain-containing protein 2B isoform X2 n=1 Tax=Sceloporus undulatus TaxID=8520 RepID=UPI001C4C62C8|nr:doublecortin domain-containing protein 2B isoform X2 [Sceloporus undulatus]